MKHHRDRRRHRAPATTEYALDPAADPNLLFGAPVPAQARRKLEQLCRQVEERLALVLAGEIDDSRVAALTLLGVEPEPGSGNLVVVLALPPGAGAGDAIIVARRLDAMRAFLRAEVAAAIHRKRTPNLIFRVVPAPQHPEDES